MDALTPHLPVLQIIVPLIIAPLILLLRSRHAAWLLATLAALFCLYSSTEMLAMVQARGAIDYRLGNWPDYVGIAYRIDVANAYILTIVSAMAVFIFPYAKRSVEEEIDRGTIPYFYSALVLCFTGLMGIAATGDAFNIFVFLEISSLSTYALVAMGDRKGEPPHASMAAYRYLIIGTIGGTFILLGIGFLYIMTGTLNIRELSTLLPALNQTSTVRAAFAFITVGASIKLALFPLHLWLPNTYTYAPSAVSAFLSSTATKVSYYVLLRTIFTLFGAAFVVQATQLKLVVAPLAIIAIFSGSINAIYQVNVKRLLAYSSVAQIGYMVLGLALNNVDGLTGGLIHLFNHALMKGGLFLVLGCVFVVIRSAELKDMRGLGKRMPLTMLAFAIGGLGLIGAPLTAGFVSKWYLVLGALEAGLWWVAALILIASLLALVYVFKVIEVAYFQEPPDDWDGTITEAPISMLIPTYVLIGASVYFGIYTRPMLSAARQAAEMFLAIGGGQ